MSRNATSPLCLCQGLNADSYSCSNPRLTSEMESFFQPKAAGKSVCPEGEVIGFSVDCRLVYVKVDIRQHKGRSLQIGCHRATNKNFNLRKKRLLLRGTIGIIYSKLYKHINDAQLVKFIKQGCQFVINCVLYCRLQEKKSFLKENNYKYMSLFLLCSAMHPLPGLKKLAKG